MHPPEIGSKYGQIAFVNGTVTICLKAPFAQIFRRVKENVLHAFSYHKRICEAFKKKGGKFTTLWMKRNRLGVASIKIVQHGTLQQPSPYRHGPDCNTFCLKVLFLIVGQY